MKACCFDSLQFKYIQPMPHCLKQMNMQSTLNPIYTFIQGHNILAPFVLFGRSKNFGLLIMSTLLLVNKLETDLIMNHHHQIQQLEVQYMNRINALLQQKHELLMALQKQFVEKRNYIKHQISNAHSEDLSSLTIELKGMDPPNIKIINHLNVEGNNREMSVNLSSLSDLTSLINNQPIQPSNCDDNAHCDEYHQQESQTTIDAMQSSNDKIYKYDKNPRHGGRAFKSIHSGCNQPFVKRSRLMQHSMDKMLQCKLLGSIGNDAFSAKTNLDDHIKQMLIIKDYKCSFCDKTFVRKHELMIHSRCHKGEKSFECKHCKKRFNDRNKLTSHMCIQRHN